MSTIVSRLDITEIFCDVDDFCKQWEHLWQQIPQLPSTIGEMTEDLIGKLFGDRGYVSQKLFEELYERGKRVNY
ncbi:MAG: transposase [Nostoc sp.]